MNVANVVDAKLINFEFSAEIILGKRVLALMVQHFQRPGWLKQTES